MSARRTLTEQEISLLVEGTAKKAAEEAVAKTLLTFGFDAANPLEVQRDLQHLREWRQAVGTIKKQSLMTAVGILTAGVLGAIWFMLRGGHS